MSANARAWELAAGNRLSKFLPTIATVLFVVSFLACPTGINHAAIVGSGDVNPSDPNTWTSTTTGCIGQSSTGTVTVDGESSLISYYCRLGYNAGSTGTATVNGTGSKWTNSGTLWVGNAGDGTLMIEAGGQLVCNNNNYFSSYLGCFSGSTGVATVTGIGSKWINGGTLYVGNSGDGTLNIEAGGQVNNASGYLGYNSGSTGTATITGTGSMWTNSGTLWVGNSGSGKLTVTDGGAVTAGMLFASLGDLFGNGTITTKGAVLDADLVFDGSHGVQQTVAFGTGGALNLSLDGNNGLGVGHKGTGTLRIAEGVMVASSSGYLGCKTGSTGTATITGTGSKWTNNGDLYVGNAGDGTLMIETGGQLVGNNYSSSYLGYGSGSTGRVTVTGIGSKWTNSGLLDLGFLGSGTLNIEAGGEVSSENSDLGGRGGSGTVIVTGIGSKWTNGNWLSVGSSSPGNGTLNIEAGGEVSSGISYLGDIGTGTATVSGTGSMWTNNGALYIGNSGDGTLSVEAGGQVSNIFAYLGQNSGSTGTVTVTGAGSKWDSSGDLYVGNSGDGTLMIEAGGQLVSNNSMNNNSYLGYNPGSTGVATVSGIGSTWTNSSSIIVGRSGSGILNIGDGSDGGGLVKSYYLKLAANSGSAGTCNINNGGTLQTVSITKGTGAAIFNWNDGTIQNYNVNLTVFSNLVLKLAATGTHAFNIDPGRTGTVDAVLKDATIGGTLTKRGAGALVLTGVNTYSGNTTIEAGRFKVTGTTLGTSGITVDAAGTLELARTQGNATAASLPIDNDGLLLVSAGAQKAGAITGGGMTQVNAGASLTASSILQDSLIIGATGAAGSAAMSQVPEPGTLALLLAGIVAGLAWRWRLSKKQSVLLLITCVFSCLTTANHAAIVGTGNVSPANPTSWTSSTYGYIGSSSTGTVTVNDGSGLISYCAFLGSKSGSFGTVTVTGANSSWRTSSHVYIGDHGNGTLNIESGGYVNNANAYLGYYTGAYGTATVTGTGSMWNISNLYIGYDGNGTLNIESGGYVSSYNAYLGHYSGATGSATVTGSGSRWFNGGDLFVGNGTLTVADGGEVTAKVLYGSLNSLLGNGVITATQGAVLDTDLVFDSTHGKQQTFAFGSGGTLNLNFLAGGNLGAGYHGVGTLRIAEGSAIASSYGYLGYRSGSAGAATITGAGSTWTNYNDLYVGMFGAGSLNVEAGGQVSNAIGYVGYAGAGSATVTGTGSTWTNTKSLYVGSYGGPGTLDIEAGGQVSSKLAYIGDSATGTVRIAGVGSKWTVTDNLYLRGPITVTEGGTLSVNILQIRPYNSATGTLTVSNGGTVEANTIYGSPNDLLGNGTVTTHGIVLDSAIAFDSALGSQLTIPFGSGGALNMDMNGITILGAGFNGTGSLRISDGITVASSDAFLGYNSSANGTATVVGAESKWIIGNQFYLSNMGYGTLNLGDSSNQGGMVAARDLHLTGDEPVNNNATCNINNGGVLKAWRIVRGVGVVNFNWNDGTIQNYDANTDLTVGSSLTIKLAATGTHAFNIDTGRTGTVDAVLKNATINGTLTKTGAGILTLTGANTYSGETVIEAGTLKYSTAAAMTSGPYTVNGGTLDIGAISKSIGAFRITSGAVNGTGTLTSNAPYDVQAGTVNPRLAGTVGLNKNGAGVLMLTGANTYRGETVIEAGRFKVTGTILNTSEVTVNAAGTLELARTSGNATAATLPIGNDGMLLVSTGSQMAGAITGNGITQVNAGASLTASSIVQDSLIIGATGAADATAMSQVPEPGTLVLLFAGFVGGLSLFCRKIRLE